MEITTGIKGFQENVLLEIFSVELKKDALHKYKFPVLIGNMKPLQSNDHFLVFSETPTWMTCEVRIHFKDHFNSV